MRFNMFHFLKVIEMILMTFGETNGKKSMKKKLEAAWKKINIALDDGFEEWDYEIREMKEDLQNKYWPTCCKTKHGKTRCSGMSGGSMPKYPWSEDELKHLLSAEISAKIQTLQIY